MKFKSRDTARRVHALRITAPETRVDEGTGKRIVMLSYINAGSYQVHVPTTKDLFLYAAGTEEEGEPSDGLDRILHHQFTVHEDAKGKAIGIDVIPNRLYRSGVVPIKQKDVKTVILEFHLDGAVVRVPQRPFNFRFAETAAIIREVDKILAAGKRITVSMQVGNAGKVVAVTDNSIEIRPSKKIVEPSEDDPEELHEVDEVDEIAAADAPQVP